MKITSVTVRRLKTLGNYNNVAVEATAQVDQGEDPAAVRADLDRWVEGQIEAGKTVAEMTEQAIILSDHIESLKTSKEFARKEVRDMREMRDRLLRMSVEELMAMKKDPEIPF